MHWALVEMAFAPPPPKADLHGTETAISAYADTEAHPGVVGRLGWAPMAGEHAQFLVETELTEYWDSKQHLVSVLQIGPAGRWTTTNGYTFGAFVHGGGALALTGDTSWIASAGLELGHTLRRSRVEAWFVRPGVAYDTTATLAVQAGVRF
jgi:hypothetical protein